MFPKHRLPSSAGRYQETEGPPIAEEIMKRKGIDASVIDRVCYLIGNHHSYGKIDGIDIMWPLQKNNCSNFN